jgi:hypothetical protein
MNPFGKRKSDLQTDLEAERFERILARSAIFKRQHMAEPFDLVAWNRASSRTNPMASAFAVHAVRRRQEARAEGVS